MSDRIAVLHAVTEQRFLDHRDDDWLEEESGVLIAARTLMHEGVISTLRDLPSVRSVTEFGGVRYVEPVILDMDAWRRAMGAVGVPLSEGEETRGRPR